MWKLASSFVIEKKIEKKNPLSDEFCDFYDTAGSVLDSQHYIPPWIEICKLIISAY